MQDFPVGLWGLFTSAFISATVAPGGSEVVLAYLVAQGQYPVLQLLWVATVANTLGAMTTWGLGMLLAKKVTAASLLSASKQKALETVKTKGQWVLLFSWLPIVGDGFCFAAGWLGLPWLTGLLLILVGKLGRYALITWVFN